MNGDWLAIVPMKRHSARVPGKNARLLNGRPLYVWTLRTLAAVRGVGTIVVDTDAEELADQVRSEFPVAVSIRPERLRGDCVSMNEVIAHVLSCFPNADRILQTHVTNPLLTPATIERAIATFERTPACDSLFTVTPIHARLYDRGGAAINHDPRVLCRTQDLPPIYEENSNLYLFTRASFSTRRSRIGFRPMLFPMNKIEAIDIDEEEDFLLAEAIMARRARWAREGDAA